MVTHSDYFKTLLMPAADKKPADRRQWGIGLQSTWIPFFTAANVDGLTHIPSDALGAPVRLVKDKDSGEVKFGQNGRPRTTVVKPIGEAIRTMRENYERQLQMYAGDVAASQADAYSQEVAQAQRAGLPITEMDTRDLLHAIAMRQAEEAANEPEKRLQLAA